MFMTMELWQMGGYLPAGSLLIMEVAILPFLIGLSHYAGFEQTSSWFEDVLDAFVAYAVGFVIAGGSLGLLRVFGAETSFRDAIGKLVIQAVPASMGASLAQSQLGQKDDTDQEKKRKAGYFGELFIMAAGALYLAFNIAPTEEIVLLSLRITPALSLAIVAVSTAILYVFVYYVNFRGEEVPPPGTSRIELILHYVLGGYFVVWITAGLVMWGFGRLDGLSLVSAVMMVTVLTLPCSVGAAAARLVI